MSDAREQHVLERTDHLRATPGRAPRASNFKEWTYFFVSSAQLDLMLTFAFLGRVDLRRDHPLPSARVIVLARTRDGRWSGSVEEVPPSAVRATPGRIDLTMGHNELAFRSGAYEIAAHAPGAGIDARLRLRPIMQPAIGTSVRMGAAEPMRWIVVPHLAASGDVRIAGSPCLLADAPAYHDHNWGAFSWGGDFAWEWGLVLASPAGGPPWTVVYSRICDRARQRVRSQALLVWRGSSFCRTFRDDEIVVRETGLLRGGAQLRVPPVMSLVEPGVTADVPGELVARASSESDEIEVRFICSDFAEIAVPNETAGLGSTLLCETAARAVVKGTFQGEQVVFSGPAVLELNHAAASDQPPRPAAGRPD